MEHAEDYMLIEKLRNQDFDSGDKKVVDVSDGDVIINVGKKLDKLNKDAKKRRHEDRKIYENIEDGMSWTEKELPNIEESFEPKEGRRKELKAISELREMDTVTPEIIGEVIFEQVAPVGAQKKICEAEKMVNDATPYIFGKKVIANNNLCFLDMDNNDNCIHKYNGRFWEKLDDEALKQLAYDSLDESMKVATRGIETLVTNIANYVKREIKKAYNDGKKRFTSEDYSKIRNRIVFSNCVYDLAKRKKHKFSAKLPYYYAINCEYIDEEEETPVYDKFKRDATGDDKDSMDMFDYMQAYLLIPNQTGKCFFIMSHAKDSGKTTFGNFIEKYFSEGMCRTFDPDHLGGNFSNAGMDKALLLTCLEMNVTRLSKSGMTALKRFSGEGKMRVEAKYQNPITSDIKFKMLLASNGGLYLPPGVQDDAFYRRVIVIPFVYSTPLDQLRADMPKAWEEERSAIISKCVRKFGKCIAKDGGIVFPESELSKCIKANWSGKSFINESFIKEALVYTGKADDAIPKDDIKLYYDEYYEDKISGIGFDSPMQCSKDELIKILHNIYPHSSEKKLRRSSVNEPNNNPKPCVIGIRWSDEFKSKHGDRDFMVQRR